MSVAVAWSTDDEIWYLDRIGRGTRGVGKVNSVELLRRYRIGALRRTQWDAIDKATVLRHLKLTLDKAGKAGKAGKP